MVNSLVQPSKALGYTDIYLDFVAGNDQSGHFYLAKNLADVANRLDEVSFERKAMVDVLTRQNKLYDAGEKTFAHIREITDPDAVCVFAGQQAGFLGGPMYTIIKALATIKAARTYREQLGRPVIPMFWIAGDDHDFEEVNHTSVLDRQGEVTEIAYRTPPPKEVSTAEIVFSDNEELSNAKEQLKEALGETDFTPDLYDLIDRSYTPQDTMCSAFGKLMAGLTREFGLVLFCPGDPAAKRIAVPLFKQIIANQEQLHDILVRRNNEIVQSGYHIQVEKKDNAAHLFYNIDGRTPVLRDGDGFTVGEKQFSREELERCIEDHPERFSPDVITRPILQSFLLPTVSQKGGPAEIAYLAQINPIFNLFGLPAPVHKARPTVTIIEKRFEKLMKQHDISFEEITGDIEQVINRILQETFPQDLERHFAQLKQDVEQRFKEFLEESLEFDPNLKQVGKQSYGKIDYTLKQFEGKVFSSHKKKSKQARDRIYRLWHALYPNRGFQERTINPAYFISKYGFGFVHALYEAMDSEETAHQLIHLSEVNL